LLERTFPIVYGLPLKDVLAHEDLAIGSYRYSVSQLIPKMTKVALQTHQKDLMRETPNFSKTKFLYRLSRSDYERQWGKTYTKPGFGTRVFSALLKYIPKVGPFKGMGFDNPTPKTEDLYIKSINATVDQYRTYLKAVSAGALVLPNRDLDDGKVTEVLEYSLADNAYAGLLAKLTARKFEGTSPQLRDDILKFYSGYSASISVPAAKPSAHSEAVMANLEDLKAAVPVAATGQTTP